MSQRAETPPATLHPLGWPAFLAAAALTGLSIAVYLPALGCEFVELDDGGYVVRNPWVSPGLSWQGLRRAATEVVGSNWHPLTMVSHQADCQLYGLEPRGHHLTSILWHAATTALLFLLGLRLTGRFVPCLAAAALWSWHPLRVESVAWVSERKDVLSGFFGLLSLWFYAAWAVRGGAIRFLLAGSSLAAGLLCKSMLVTWPAVMVLLDYWPLGRWRPDDLLRVDAWPRLGRLIAEKWLFWLLALASSMLTLSTQSQVAVRSLERLPLVWRLANALASLADYLGQTVWPARMACFYPHPGAAPNWISVVTGALLLVGTFWGAWRLRGQQPYLLVGWCWFVGTLLPVVGLIQVGGHARADRYTYLPSIGIATAVVGLVGHWAGGDRRRLRGVGLAAGAVALALAATTWRQIGVWHDTESLFRHAAAVTDRNFLAYASLGNVLSGRGEFQAALVEFDRALAYHAQEPLATLGKAYCLARLDRPREAIVWYQRALDQQPGDPRLRFNLAEMLAASGRRREAALAYRQVVAECQATGAGQWAELAALATERLNGLGSSSPAPVRPTAPGGLPPQAPSPD